MLDLTDGVPGITGPKPETFEEFWPYYLSQHLHPTTRAMHATGTLAALAFGLAGVVRRRPTAIALAPLLAYGPAFASHFIWEGNKPATLGGYARWSVGGDFRMLWKTLTGTADADVAAIREALDMSPDQITLADRDRADSVWRSVDSGESFEAQRATSPKQSEQTRQDVTIPSE